MGTVGMIKRRTGKTIHTTICNLSPFPSFYVHHSLYPVPAPAMGARLQSCQRCSVRRLHALRLPLSANRSYSRRSPQHSPAFLHLRLERCRNEWVDSHPRHRHELYLGIPLRRHARVLPEPLPEELMYPILSLSWNMPMTIVRKDITARAARSA